jgi:hypothetical protein
MRRHNRSTGSIVARRAATVIAAAMAAVLPLAVAQGQPLARTGSTQASATSASFGGFAAGELPFGGLSGTGGIVEPSALGGGRSGPSGSPDGSEGGSRLVAGVQVTAHDGAFWQGANKVTFHGANLVADRAGLSAFKASAQEAAGWGMNFVRLDVHWATVEPTGPKKLRDGTWQHTYDTTATIRIAQDMEVLSKLGRVAIINNTHDGSFWGYPSWQYQAQYNSHGIDYPQTPDGQLQANTDFWSDPLRQQFMIDWLRYLAVSLKLSPSVVGYEVLNEPNEGSLPVSLETTQLIVDWQLQAARAIRGADPNRAIMFMTRHGFGPGLPHVDLSGWTDPRTLKQPLGFPDVAADVHDYFGGRWGTGLRIRPGDPTNLEDYEELYTHVLSDDPVTYIGTTQGQMQWVRDKLASLDPWGFPLLVGEFGDRDTDAGATLFFGTTTAAFAYTKVSWSVSRGNLGITDANDGLQPWAQIVIDAAKDYP